MIALLKRRQDEAGCCANVYLTPRRQPRIRADFVRGAWRGKVLMLRMGVIAAELFLSAILIQLLLQRGHGTLGPRLTGYGQVGWAGRRG